MIRQINYVDVSKSAGWDGCPGIGHSRLAEHDQVDLVPARQPGQQ
jgi:hypothetical protein